MNTEAKKALQKIFKSRTEILNKTWDEGISDVVVDHHFDKEQSIQKLIESEILSLGLEEKSRVCSEIDGLGPLQSLIDDPEVTEILVNRFDFVYYEKNGELLKSSDHFYDEITYNQTIERLAQLCHSYINKDKPFLETQYQNLRLTLIYKDLASGAHLLSIRKQPLEMWTMSQLIKNNWCTSEQLIILNKMISNKENFICVGGTSSGKTSALQALIGLIPENQRVVAIEDTPELHFENQLCTSLLTRQDYIDKNNNVEMSDLLKRALRLRPDRLVIGEIRGPEATSLLMALSTGHAGSFGSLHARTAAEALLRLEMLVQIGAPQWSLNSIRKLIGLTINTILVVEKKHGQRKLEGIYRLSSVEEHGITLMKVDSDLNMIY